MAMKTARAYGMHYHDESPSAAPAPPSFPHPRICDRRQFFVVVDHVPAFERVFTPRQPVHVFE